jgi:enoyl-CoA hydratase/carnithine racemase
MSEQMSAMRGGLRPFKDYKARHFLWETSGDGRVATIRLNRPDKKNPLTFDSYAELRDLFRDLVYASDVRAVVLAGSGGNFCSGGDVFEIIEPLTRMPMPDLLAFTRMTGDLVRAMRKMPPADHCRRRRHLRWCRRHSRDGLRPALCDP